jgi:tetratricopeptide (TPR) repeat protein
MKSDTIGLSYFRLSPDFNYRRYLENRSHFTELSSDISREHSQTREALAKLTYASDGLAQSVNEIAEGTRSSVEYLSTISDQLDATNDTLRSIEIATERTNEILDMGFSRLISGMCGLQDTMEELLAAVKSPERTWAFEQFDLARECFGRRLFDECLRYLDSAINGDSGHQGYPIEYRFYLLRGVVLLGDAECAGEPFVSPTDAAAAFDLAAKYALPTERRTKARCLTYAGWALYCSGKEPEAVARYETALSVDDKCSEAHFQLSRLMLFRGDLEKGSAHLLRSIQINVFFAVVATEDATLAGYSAELKKVIEAQRRNLIVRHKAICQRTFSIVSDVGEYVRQYANEKLALEPVVNRLHPRNQDSLLELHRRLIFLDEELHLAGIEISQLAAKSIDTVISKRKSALPSYVSVRSEDDGVSGLETLASVGLRSLLPLFILLFPIALFASVFPALYLGWQIAFLAAIAALAVGWVGSLIKRNTNRADIKAANERNAASGRQSSVVEKFERTGREVLTHVSEKLSELKLRGDERLEPGKKWSGPELA